jgi:hypothetical protein
MSQPVVTFLSRIRKVGIGKQDLSVCEVLRSPNPKDAGREDLWKTVFMGTQDECGRYTANMHHAIEPGMIENFDPRKDVRRKI